MKNEDWLILNIDDQPAIRYAKTRALQRGGFKVMEAPSGTEGLACVEQYRPALVVCDVKMPDINGLEVARTIKQRWPGTLVLQVSASFVTAHDRATGLDCGADSYLTEPVEPEELVASVRALLRMKAFELELRAANARQAFVFGLAERQRAAGRAEDILQIACESLAQNLEAGRVGIYEVQGDFLRHLSCWSDGRWPAVEGEMPATALAGFLEEAYRQGRSIAVSDLSAAGVAVPDTDYAAIGVPIVRSGAWRATLYVNADAGREWAEEDVTLAQEVAQLTWDAVERARAFQDLRRLNETLEERIAQRSRELVEAEAQLRQAQKMEAVGQLTGGLAHDFNNLLTGIIGGINMIRRRISRGETGDLDRFMDEVVKSAHRAAGLIQRLLAFSRQQSLDVKPVDVKAMLTNMSGLFRRTVGETVAVAFQLSDDLWPAETDVNQLEAAILNLVINGRDAMPDGGTITIRGHNRCVTPETVTSGLEIADYVVLEVADTGTGMRPEVIDRAFDPFFTTKPVGQGTGLGLSMIYGFVKQGRGHVEIDSRVGQGTTVRLFLPRGLSRPLASLDPASMPAMLGGRGEFVLLAEDDSAVRLLVSDLLKELGYQLIVCDNGARAAEILASGRKIDLLLTDVGLPGMNGRQVAEIGRRHWPGMKILFVTGYAEAARLRAGFLPEGADMVAKPFELENLAGKIRALLNSDWVPA